MKLKRTETFVDDLYDEDEEPEQDNFTVEDAENIVSLAEDLLTVAKDLKEQIKLVLCK